MPLDKIRVKPGQISTREATIRPIIKYRVLSLWAFKSLFIILAKPTIPMRAPIPTKAMGLSSGYL